MPMLCVCCALEWLWSPWLHSGILTRRRLPTSRAVYAQADGSECFSCETRSPSLQVSDDGQVGAALAGNLLRAKVLNVEERLEQLA